MSRFLRALLLITLIAHMPFFLGVHEFAARIAWSSPWLVAWLSTTSAVLLFLGRARAAMPDRKRSAAVSRLIDIPYFVHWCACIFTLVPAALGVVVLATLDLARAEPVALHGGFYLALYATGLVVCGYGVLIRRRLFRTLEIDVPVVGLAPSYDGYRIAHLSDLHIGALTPREWGLRWARASNAAKPDLVAVTGDMVTSGVEFHSDIADVIGALEGRDGVVVSMGNHDYFGEGEPLITLLRSRGARVLRNEGVVLSNGTGKLHVAAIEET
jgi:uncharacterized protein